MEYGRTRLCRESEGWVGMWICDGGGAGNLHIREESGGWPGWETAKGGGRARFTILMSIQLFAVTVSNLKNSGASAR